MFFRCLSPRRADLNPTGARPGDDAPTTVNRPCMERTLTRSACRRRGLPLCRARRERGERREATAWPWPTRATGCDHSLSQWPLQCLELRETVTMRWRIVARHVRRRHALTSAHGAHCMHFSYRASTVKTRRVAEIVHWTTASACSECEASRGLQLQAILQRAI